MFKLLDQESRKKVHFPGWSLAFILLVDDERRERVYDRP
jgi:hypothetical protein